MHYVPYWGLNLFDEGCKPNGPFRKGQKIPLGVLKLKQSCNLKKMHALFDKTLFWKKEVTFWCSLQLNSFSRKAAIFSQNLEFHVYKNHSSKQTSCLARKRVTSSPAILIAPYWIFYTAKAAFKKVLDLLFDLWPFLSTLLRVADPNSTQLKSLLFNRLGKSLQSYNKLSMLRLAKDALFTKSKREGGQNLVFASVEG